MTLPALAIVTAYLGVIAVLSAYGLHRLYIARLYRRWRDHPPSPRDLAQLPHVTVQLPIFNERNVVERLVDAACRLDWPAQRLEVQVLDDSLDATTDLARALASKWRARGIDITVIHRTDRTGYKAGALEAGARCAKGQLLAVFDADFVPPPQFLRRAVPYFDGFGPGPHQIGMVQARWGHLNEQANLLTRLSAVLLDGHFVVEHTARHRSGRFFNFNGTAGIWRKDCIVDAGGWQHDTLTEDLDLSYRAQLQGWQFVFLRDDVVPAELPADMRAFKLQQHRWAKGTMQTARKLLPRILHSTQPWRVKLEATIHLTSNLAYPLVLLLGVLLPLAVAARGHGDLSQVLFFDLPTFIMATCSVAIFYALAEHDAHPGRWLTRLWRIPLTMSLGIGMAVNQTRAVVEGIFGTDVTFLRTPKAGDQPTHSDRLAIGWTPVVELSLALYYAVAIVWCLWQGFWSSLPFMLLFGFGFAYVGAASLTQALSELGPKLRHPGKRPRDIQPASAAGGRVA
ncbi:MAG: glycosyltransferase [Oligoflexia bacterium]|nr:glycosyltransferase [Oligoflexia bacterium]